MSCTAIINAPPSTAPICDISCCIALATPMLAVSTDADKRAMSDGAAIPIEERSPDEVTGYRGARFADWPRDLRGNNDLLVLTQPAIIAGIHRAYLEAGADIIETSTFNSTRVAMADYAMESLVRELNVEGARLAQIGRAHV